MHSGKPGEKQANKKMPAEGGVRQAGKAGRGSRGIIKSTSPNFFLRRGPALCDTCEASSCSEKMPAADGRHLSAVPQSFSSKFRR